MSTQKWLPAEGRERDCANQVSGVILSTVRFNASTLRDGRSATAEDVVLVPGTIAGPGMKEGPFLLLSQTVQQHLPEFEIAGVFQDDYIQVCPSQVDWCALTYL